MNYLVMRLKAKEIMTRNPTAISADATIGEAARIMLEKKISGLPVVDGNNRVIGIITESDIFRLVVQEWGKKESAPVAVSVI
jgi:acetoin utilization protein AcuB